MKIEIREATIEDLRDIQKLNHELCKKENKEFDSTINSDWPLSEEGEEYFKDRISEKDGYVLIALIDGEIVGYLAGGIVEAEDYRNISNIAELENMFIVKEHRSKNIGAKLYKVFVDWCKEKEIERIKVVVSSENIKAINFYKNNKFKDYDIVLENEI